MVFLQDAVIKARYRQYLPAVSLFLSAVSVEPRFRSANQSFPCYQTRPRFNICQQIKPAEGSESGASRSMQEAAKRVTKRRGNLSD